MQTNKVSQAKPMAVWCALVATLIAVVIAIGVAMFYMPGRGAPVEKSSPAPSSAK